MELSAPAWVSWTSLGLTVAVSIILFASKNWIIARITKDVQHDFDVKLENIRAALKNNEEQLKSALREKELEIEALRTSVLSGSAGRQALLDKRRFEAVEKIWTAVNDFTPLKGLYQMTASLNYDAIAKQINNPKIQQFLGTIITTAADPRNIKNVARDERPFVPEISWSYFDAYITLLYFNFARFETLKLGQRSTKTRKYRRNKEHIESRFTASS